MALRGGVNNALPSKPFKKVKEHTSNNGKTLAFTWTPVYDYTYKYTCSHNATVTGSETLVIQLKGGGAPKNHKIAGVTLLSELGNTLITSTNNMAIKDYCTNHPNGNLLSQSFTADGTTKIMETCKVTKDTKDAPSIQYICRNSTSTLQADVPGKGKAKLERVLLDPTKTYTIYQIMESDIHSSGKPKASRKVYTLSDYKVATGWTVTPIK